MPDTSRWTEDTFWLAWTDRGAVREGAMGSEPICLQTRRPAYPENRYPDEACQSDARSRYENRHLHRNEWVTFVFNRASLSEQVEAALRQEITLGRLRPGQKINASDYLANWNVSITPFRDAVRTLQNQGFVTVEPRKGVYVAPLNLKALQEIFELRIALECMAIELATSRADAGEAERVRAAYVKAGVRVRKGDGALLAETDEAVHDLGRNACGNARL